MLRPAQRQIVQTPITKNTSPSVLLFLPWFIAAYVFAEFFAREKGEAYVENHYFVRGPIAKEMGGNAAVVMAFNVFLQLGVDLCFLPCIPRLNQKAVELTARARGKISECNRFFHWLAPAEHNQRLLAARDLSTAAEKPHEIRWNNLKFDVPRIVVARLFHYMIALVIGAAVALMPMDQELDPNQDIHDSADRHAANVFTLFCGLLGVACYFTAHCADQRSGVVFEEERTASERAFRV